MANKIKQEEQKALSELHQYYASILNCMPYLVYWIDKECTLQGCNEHFSQLLGLSNISDFSGSPYKKLAKASNWSQEDIDSFRLDDMSVLFSGQALHDKALPVVTQANVINKYYLCHRDPLLDHLGHVVGVVVVMVEVTEQHLHDQRVKNANAVQHGLKLQTLKDAPRVLIVEDNMVAKQVEEALLIALQCQVDTATTGQQALILFEPGKYDLVVMDIGLEDTSGYVLSKQFRKMEKNSNFHVPIIALTSFQAELVKHDCEYYFMDGVISKPLTAEQANQIVQHYVYHQNTIVTGLKHA